MIQEPPSKAWILITVAIITGACTVIAAIVTLGTPFAERMAESYFPNTPVPNVIIVTPANSYSPSTPVPNVIITQPTNVIAPTNPPIATEVIQVAPPPTTTPDCWQTVWSFNPSSNGDISTLLSPPRVGYNASFDTSIYADSPGSLKIETTKIVEDPMQDQNAWTWMDNNQTIIANNGLYRVTAMMKTQDVVATHISVVGRDRNGLDVSKNGTNQVTVVPIVSRALYGTNDWNLYLSGEFNPKEWSSNIEYIMIGINAGWSSDGRASISWFDNVQLQYCNR